MHERATAAEIHKVIDQTPPGAGNCVLNVKENWVGPRSLSARNRTDDSAIVGRVPAGIHHMARCSRSNRSIHRCLPHNILPCSVRNTYRCKSSTVFQTDRL